MKFKAVVWCILVFAVVTGGCSKETLNSGSQIPNPAAVYCEELGYHYKINRTGLGEQGLCELHKTLTCDAWDFFTGKCGKEFTYCEINGGKITTIKENCHFTQECAICTLANGTKCDEWDYFRGKCP